MRKALGAALAVALVGCATLQPPAAVEPMKDVYVRAPFDSVWTRAVAFFADARVPISTIDRSSGLIASRAFTLDFAQLQLWGDCGSANGKPLLEQVNAAVMRGSADFNVLVKPAGDSTAVRVNVGIQGSRMNPFAGNSFTPDHCVSSGAFERALIARLTGDTLR